MKERRKHKRVPLAALIEVLSKDSDENICKGFIKNLCEEGLAFETTKRLKLDGEFKLRFTLPNGWNFDILGEIRHVNDGILTIAHGAKFTKITEKDKKNIKAYIKHKNKNILKNDYD